MDDLLEWFKEADGFSQGTKAPHKWVLQAEQEITALRARLEAVEAELAEADALIKATWADMSSNIIRLAETTHRAERAEAALADANTSVVAFCAPAAVEYAREMGLPDGHLHPTHYDILEKAGARMDSFTRAVLEKAGARRDSFTRAVLAQIEERPKARP